MANFKKMDAYSNSKNKFIAARQRLREITQGTTDDTDDISGAIGCSLKESNSEYASTAASRRRQECLKEVGRLESAFDEAFEVNKIYRFIYFMLANLLD